MSLPANALQYSFPQRGSYNNLVLKEVPVAKPRANEVLVRIHAVSLQFRDLMIAGGKYPLPARDSPVPCSDMAGEIVAIGEDVKDWKVQERVCANFCTDQVYGPATPETQATALGGAIDGVLTQYRTFPAHSLVAIPKHLSYEEASTLPCAALTAYNALHGPVPIKAGDFVLVLGTGGVSIFALQFAVAAGATVIATSSSDEKLKIASKLGAKHLINYKKTPDWEEVVNKITNGVGVDHIVEVGGGTLFKSIRSARMGTGQIHIIGHVSSGSEDPSIVFPVIRKAATLRGILIGSVAQFRDMVRVLTAHPESTRPVVDKVFPFEKATDAYAYLESQKHVGKVVIKVA
ncbi:alcohol dehydrogenase superfamily protein [Gymnopilus junonius]|uniref:Alcohol dehydrogenase superfamily protein n=1 Tax=Gymnopilus junonius TaxID=109634 RepID=A0A9P5P2J6_GYMJU|nr:alcohol dehydrogenase superfamily protein [Gymnopilus junonius]